MLSDSKTHIMGVLNVTPDSFSDGGLFLDPEKAIAYAKQMVKEGADIIDIGGESTRPGSDPVSAQEELERVIPVIMGLKNKINVPLSIDTYRPEVAEECLKLGVHMVNDITGLQDKEMRSVVAKYKASAVVMHMQGKPKTMQKNPMYNDVVEDIKTFFKERIAQARKSGIQDIILDPGIGFGKTIEHNLQILKRLQEFTDLGFPILVGPSRKSFISKVTGVAESERLEGSLAAVAVAVMNGAAIVRVHDVRETKRVVQMVDAIKKV
ncbi:dihydropteroate synthase [Patescibacteria group bacterium]|nr:dihydropteroate synthase [Patescibacteria group bacterium]